MQALEPLPVALPAVLLAIAVVLIAIDALMAPDFLSPIGYALVAGVLAYATPLALSARILCGTGTFAVLIACHYIFGRTVIQRLANRILASTRYTSDARPQTGAVGYIRTVNDKKVLVITEEIWPYDSDETLFEGDEVSVKDWDGSVIIVTRARKGDSNAT